MRLAGKRLRASQEAVSPIALSLGYESESGFCTAFKRFTARSPVQYRRCSPAIAQHLRAAQ
jgi:AraC-like DNA-binding protein